MPGGCLNPARKQWKTLRGRYLFKARNLAKVFRTRLLESLRQAGLALPGQLPSQWVVDCTRVGKGLPALTYLARYLYRGVISENNILDDDGTHVTFRFKDSRTGRYQTRTVAGEDFLWLLLQHVLPKGFRRVRDFGFLHGNARQRLTRVQVALGVIAASAITRARPPFLCFCCHQPMTIVAFVRPAWRSG
ncbi:MAG: transposase [Pseudohongiellaceae bacterium]